MKVLEIASSPYGMTAYFLKYMFPNFSGANYSESPTQKKIALTIDKQEYHFIEYGFNIESNDWQLKEEFDLVIACEVLEHLPMDPMALFVGANKILKPGGRLFVATPNQSSLQNIIKLLMFKPSGLANNFHLPPSMSSLYGRHNREYTCHALNDLFTSGGFKVDLFMTDSGWGLQDYGIDKDLLKTIQEKFDSPELRHDTLLFSGIKQSDVLNRYPTDSELYLVR